MLIFFSIKMKWIRKYKTIYKQGGVKAVLKEGGWLMLLLLFSFFLLKGLLWLAIGYFAKEAIVS